MATDEILFCGPHDLAPTHEQQYPTPNNGNYKYNTTAYYLVKHHLINKVDFSHVVG